MAANRYAGKGANKRPKSNLSTGRDYTYDKAYQKSPTQKKNRANRDKARLVMIKEGRVRRGDKKDIDHKRSLKNGGSNGRSNLQVLPQSANRAKK